MNEKEKNQPTRDFEEIFEEWHDPDGRERHKIKKRREEKIKERKKDAGL